MRGQAEIRYSRVIATCKNYVAVFAIGIWRGASDRGERAAGRQAEILCQTPRILSVSIHENVTTAFSREIAAKGNKGCYGGRAGMTRDRIVEDETSSVDLYCVRSSTTAVLS
jgi:hypothetical protein